MCHLVTSFSSLFQYHSDLAFLSLQMISTRDSLKGILASLFTTLVLDKQFHRSALDHPLSIQFRF
jgi:hypothetical protein